MLGEAGYREWHSCGCKGGFAGSAAENRPSFSNQSCQQKWNRMTMGAEEEMDRGGYEFERWEWDGMGFRQGRGNGCRKYDSAVKKVWYEKQGVRGEEEGEVLTEGMMSRHMEIRYKVLRTERQHCDTPLITSSFCRNPYLSLHLCSKCQSVITKWWWPGSHAHSYQWRKTRQPL